MNPEIQTIGAATIIRIESLGSARLLCGQPGEEIEAFGPGKPLALAVYIASSPGRLARREQLVDLLWADADPARARATLRQTLFHMRQLLGEGVVARDANVVRFGVPVAFDRDEFLACVQAGDFETAVRLYRGPFLPELAVPGGSEFEHWAEVERHRLGLIHAHVLESLARQRLDSADPLDAVRFASMLRDANPESESAWRLLLESLESSGQLVQVLVEADAMQRMLIGDDRLPEPATTSLLRRLRQRSTTKSAGDARSRGIAADLIGREREFAGILAAWKAMRADGSRSVAVVGRAGLGKTRLLRDIENRLQASGSCVTYVRARSGEDRVLGAFAADVARELAGLPGALGISPGAASALVALQPVLSSQYPSLPDPASGFDALRRRTFALAELIDSVAHERPLTLLLDDLHWADADSLSILAGAADRLGAAKVLIVTASREAGAEVRLRNGAVLALAPLTPQQLAILVRSIAIDEHGVWSDAVLDALYRGAGGTPLLVLDAVQLAMDSGQLHIRGGTWHCPDRDTLVADFLGGGSIDRRLDRLAQFERGVLRMIAVAGAPLPLESIVRCIDDSRESVIMALARLEDEGFVCRERGEYEVVHDEIAATLLRSMSETEVGISNRAVGLALASEPNLTATGYQRVARHLARAGDNVALGHIFLEWLAAVTKRGDRRSDRQLAAALLGDRCQPAEVERLLRSRPMSRRIGLRSGRQKFFAGAALLLFIAIGFARASLTASPTQVGIVVAPIAFGERLPPMPIAVVELQDARRRRVSRSGDSVWMEIAGGHGTLGGKTTVVTTNGRATFPDVTVRKAMSNDLILRFTAAGLAPANVRVTGAAEEQSRLRLVRASLNAQALTPLADTLRITPGDSILGDIEFRYTSTWVAGAVVLGVTSTWVERTHAYATIGALPTPGIGVVYRGSVRLAGPARPGTYRLIFAFQAEDAVGFVMSGTNWTVGAPVWNDGNDVADWTDAQFAQADRDGRVHGTILRTTGRHPYSVPAATIVVEAAGRE